MRSVLIQENAHISYGMDPIQLSIVVNSCVDVGFVVAIFSAVAVAAASSSSLQSIFYTLSCIDYSQSLFHSIAQASIFHTRDSRYTKNFLHFDSVQVRLPVKRENYTQNIPKII